LGVVVLHFRYITGAWGMDFVLIYKQYEKNEKYNDEIYQLAKDQALVKKFKKKDLGLFVFALRM
jgi:hypothetical protein